MLTHFTCTFYSWSLCACMYTCACVLHAWSVESIFLFQFKYTCSSLTHWHMHKHPPPPPHTHTLSLSLLHIYMCTYTRDAVRFCFGPMLHKELDEFREDWNNHRIRKSTMAETLGGRPEFLYFAPTHCGQLLQFCAHYYASILHLCLNMCRC